MTGEVFEAEEEEGLHEEGVEEAEVSVDKTMTGNQNRNVLSTFCKGGFGDRGGRGGAPRGRGAARGGGRGGRGGKPGMKGGAKTIIVRLYLTSIMARPSSGANKRLLCRSLIVIQVCLWQEARRIC